MVFVNLFIGLGLQGFLRDPACWPRLDPELNGGGAVTDFGCYGADLITWILKGIC